MGPQGIDMDSCRYVYGVKVSHTRNDDNETILARLEGLAGAYVSRLQPFLDDRIVNPAAYCVPGKPLGGMTQNEVIVLKIFARPPPNFGTL